MIFEAIKHVPLSKAAYALDEENIVIRLRVARDDMTYCRCFYGDRSGEHKLDAFTPVDMVCAYSDTYFDYFEARIKSPFNRVCYFFELNSVDGDYAYYTEFGLSTEIGTDIEQYFQMPYIHRADIIRQPQWTNDLVIYHIFPDSFATDRRYISGQGKEIHGEDGFTYASKLGGTLEGIRKNLDYLESLHINCIYLNPIFKSSAYHKYDIFDYFKVDECLGTDEGFKQLVSECHDRGIKVILDGVFNHCGIGFFAFQDVLKKQEKSKYKNWFYRLDFPVKVEFPPNYATFAYWPYMPKLNTADPEVCDYFCKVGKYWIEEMGIDGWRLDVANEVNHDFWRKFRKEVQSVKSDVLLIGEIWEDSTVWLMGDQFDSTMNYAFYWSCKEFFAKESINPVQFAERVSGMYLRYPEQVSNMQMNFLDTHDVPRFLSFCDGNMDKLKLAVTFMMTYPGIPSVFYGDECGVQGVREDEYRQPMPWNKTADLADFYREMIDLRRTHKCIQTGQFRILNADNEAGIISYQRFNEDESVTITLNRNKYTINIESAT